MYLRRKRAGVRRTELQLEWLEDRPLLSGGKTCPLLQSLLSPTHTSALVGAVRLTPLDVAGVLHEGNISLAGNLSTAIDNPNGLAVTLGGHADLGPVARTNLDANARLLQPRVKALVFSGSAWGTSGLGPVINLAAPGSPATANVKVGLGFG